MRKYETVLISDPDQSDQARTELFDKVRNIIARENGILLDFDEWGTKKLAYEIKKKLRGYYVCMTYGGTGDLVKELERNLRLSDDCMKFMTILLSDQETAESLEKEAAEAKEAKEADVVEEAAEEKTEAVEDKADAPAEESDAAEAAAGETAEEETEKTGEAAE